MEHPVNRVVPPGQSDGQRAIAELEADIAATADAILATPLEETDTAAPLPAFIERAGGLGG